MEWKPVPKKKKKERNKKWNVNTEREKRRFAIRLFSTGKHTPVDTLNIYTRVQIYTFILLIMRHGESMSSANEQLAPLYSGVKKIFC